MADPATLERFRAQKTILLTTRRRNGSPVATPVSIAFDDERAVFRTYDKSGKARRLRRDATVEIAPSSFRGKPLGPAIHARARLLSGDEARRARRALARTHPVLHGLLVPLLHRAKRYETQHYELLSREVSSSVTGSAPTDRVRETSSQ